MSDAQATRNRSSKKSTTKAAVASPPSPIDSSPLSTLLSEDGLDAMETSHLVEHQSIDQGVEGIVAGKNTDLDSAYSPPAGEDLAADEDGRPYPCQYCDKTYDNAQQLKRHVNDKKSVCYKTRGTETDEPMWSCPRCQVQMAKKYSVFRHIRDSCWKVCDECYKSDSLECDCYHRGGDCTACELAGKTCTKYTEAVTGCVPLLVTGAPVESIRVITRIKSGAGPRQRRQKRKAVLSPDSSPKAKPRSKRGAQSGENPGQNVFGSALSKIDRSQHIEDEQEPSLEHDRLPPILPTVHTRNAPSASLLLKRNPHPRAPLGAIARPDGETAADVAFPDTVQESQSSRMLPPPHVRPAFGVAQDMPRESTHDIVQRHLQAARNLSMSSQFATGNGNGMYPTSVNSDLRTSINIGQPGWPSSQSQGLPQNTARAGLPGPFHIYEDQPQTHGLQLLNNGAPGSRVPSGQSSIFGDNMRLSAPDSRVSSRQSSVIDGGLSAPGSRVSSRQPSRQSSAEPLRSSLNSNAPGQTNTEGNSEDAGGLIVKLPMPHVLKQKLTLEPSPQVADPDNPSIRLRIHSNTYDSNGAPIFSILTMRMHDQFGPRFDYFCTQRGKRYGPDWKFVFKYPAPAPHNPTRQKYFDLKYTMMPVGCRDKEYPGAAMRSGDTILVVFRRPGAPVPVIDDEELGTQLECQTISIQGGETEIWQSPDVNHAWFRNADRDLAVTRYQLGMHHNELVKMRNVQFHRENLVAGLQAQNAQLKAEVEMLRSVRVPQMDGYQDGGAAYTRQGPGFSHARHRYPGGDVQARSGFLSSSVTNYLQAQGRADARGQDAVHGVADQIAAEEDEE